MRTITQLLFLLLIFNCAQSKSQVLQFIPNAPVAFDYVKLTAPDEYDAQKPTEHWERDSNGSIYHQMYDADGKPLTFYAIDSVPDGCSYRINSAGQVSLQDKVIAISHIEITQPRDGKFRIITKDEYFKNLLRMQNGYAEIPYTKEGAVHRTVLGEKSVDGMRIFGNRSEDSRDPQHYRDSERWNSELGFLYATSTSPEAVADGRVQFSGYRAINVHLSDPPKEHFELLNEAAFPNLIAFGQARTFYLEVDAKTDTPKDKFVEILTRSGRWQVTEDRNTADMTVQINQLRYEDNQKHQRVSYTVAFNKVAQTESRSTREVRLLSLGLSDNPQDEGKNTRTIDVCFANLWQRIENKSAPLAARNLNQ